MKDTNREKVVNLLKVNEPRSAKHVGRVLGISAADASSTLSKLFFEGWLDRKKTGREFFYTKRTAQREVEHTPKPREGKGKKRGSVEITDEEILENLAVSLNQALPVIKKYARIQRMLEGLNG